MAVAAGIDDASRRLEKLDFHHPYTPYDVQEQFMRTVYDVLDKGDGQVGILESPTGTVSDTSLPRISLLADTCLALHGFTENHVMPDH